MQNKEIEEVDGKKVRFVLFDQSGNQFNEESILKNKNSQPQYYIIWYDKKMKNYQLLVDYLTKSKQLLVDVQPILVVDEKRFMDKIIEIWSDSE